MVFESKFSKLSPEFLEQLGQIVKEIGIHKTAQQYYEKAGMSFIGFYRQLTSKFGNKDKLVPLGKPFKKTKPDFGKKRSKTLTSEEEMFLENLGAGTVSLEDASKMVAVRVFRKMLENPDDVKFIDFFRTELLRLKQDENKVKETWGKEVIARMFAGKLPPSVCPRCGTQLINDSPFLMDGETTTHETKSLSTDS